MIKTKRYLPSCISPVLTYFALSSHTQLSLHAVAIFLQMHNPLLYLPTAFMQSTFTQELGPLKLQSDIFGL